MQRPGPSAPARFCRFEEVTESVSQRANAVNFVRVRARAVNPPKFHSESLKHQRTNEKANPDAQQRQANTQHEQSH